MQGDPSELGPTQTEAAAGSSITLVDARTRQSYQAAPASSVELSSVRQRWLSPLVFEVHRMAPHAYDEHVLVGHRLIINLGRPVPFGWKSGDQTREATLELGGFCLQSEGDSNAPFWREEMLFAAVAIPPAMIEQLLEERAPRPAETFAERRCTPELAAYKFARALAAELSSPSEPTYAAALAQAFTLHLLSAHGRGTAGKRVAPKGKLGSAQLRAVAELAHEQLGSGDLSLDSLATAAGYSPFQFARLFKATTGQPPHQFVLQLRLERAQTLLRSTGRSGLAAAALAAGFYDQAHMTNVFRKMLGITPAAFAGAATG